MKFYVHFHRSLWLLSSASGGTLKGWPANYQDLPLAKTPSLLAPESLKASREDQLIQAAPHGCQRQQSSEKVGPHTFSCIRNVAYILFWLRLPHLQPRQAGLGRLRGVSSVPLGVVFQYPVLVTNAVELEWHLKSLNLKSLSVISSDVITLNLKRDRTRIGFSFQVKSNIKIL